MKHAAHVVDGSSLAAFASFSDEMQKLGGALTSALKGRLGHAAQTAPLGAAIGAMSADKGDRLGGAARGAAGGALAAGALGKPQLRGAAALGPGGLRSAAGHMGLTSGLAAAAGTSEGKSRLGHGVAGAGLGAMGGAAMYGGAHSAVQKAKAMGVDTGELLNKVAGPAGEALKGFGHLLAGGARKDLTHTLPQGRLSKLVGMKPKTVTLPGAGGRVGSGMEALKNPATRGEASKVLAARGAAAGALGVGVSDAHKRGQEREQHRLGRAYMAGAQDAYTQHPGQGG